jgi:hypothetical protein
MSLFIHFPRMCSDSFYPCGTDNDTKTFRNDTTAHSIMPLVDSKDSMVMTYRYFIFTIAVIAAFGLQPSHPANAADDTQADTSPGSQPQNNEIQSLKAEVLKINRELFMIEEDILYPQSTQFTVFVSLDVGDFFALDSVQLRVDDKIVANYLYTKREITALKEGGVQRLYLGNLKNGAHEFTAYFIGKGPHDRDYKRGVTKVVDKELSPLFVELKIVDNAGEQQPDFEVAIWDQ